MPSDICFLINTYLLMLEINLTSRSNPFLQKLYAFHLSKLPQPYSYVFVQPEIKARFMDMGKQRTYTIHTSFVETYKILYKGGFKNLCLLTRCVCYSFCFSLSIYEIQIRFVHTHTHTQLPFLLLYERTERLKIQSLQYFKCDDAPHGYVLKCINYRKQRNILLIPNHRGPTQNFVSFG